MKKLVSEVGYAIINKISDVKIPRNTGDFRIISRRVIEELRVLSESHGFLRGLVAFVGYPQAFVEYDRDRRLNGPGNYNRYLGSMKIGFNGVFGFSTSPLSIMLWSGFIIAILSTILVFVMIAAKFILQADYPLGIPTITILILFMGGVQLMSVGVLGEYIGRIYDEVRRRPHFIVDRAVNVPLRDAHGAGRTGYAGRAVVGESASTGAGAWGERAQGGPVLARDRSIGPLPELVATPTDGPPR